MENEDESRRIFCADVPADNMKGFGRKNIFRKELLEKNFPVRRRNQLKQVDLFSKGTIFEGG